MKNDQSVNSQEKKIVFRRCCSPGNGQQLVGFIFFLLVMIIFFWGTIWIIHWVNVPERALLSQLAIIGNRQFTTDADIQQAIRSLGPQNTFIDQDVEAIEQEIRRLPWIKAVSVQKKWPNQLWVQIVEYLPFAYWNDAYLVDDEGIIFNITNQGYSLLLPKLYGPENTEKRVVAMYQYIKGFLKKNVANNGFKLLAVSVNERYSWTIQVKANQKKLINKKRALCHSEQPIKVILGRGEVRERLQRLTLLYPTIEEKTKNDEYLTTIDLRYNSGASVQRRQLWANCHFKR